MDKTRYINQVLIIITALAQSISTADILINTYFDRAYGSLGVHEITDEDLVGYGITAAQLASAITLFQQLQNLRSGQAVAVADYDATLNQLRQDI